MQLETMFPGEDGKTFIGLLLDGDMAEHRTNNTYMLSHILNMQLT